MSPTTMSAHLVTARLELRPFGPRDGDELHEIFADPATNTVGGGPFTARAHTSRWIERRLDVRARYGLAWYAVRDRESGVLLGNCGILPGRTGPVEPEIGYLIRRADQGRGLATEAATAVLAAAFAAGITRVWATIRPANSASLRVAAALGMVTDAVRADEKGPLVHLFADRPDGALTPAPR